MDLLGFQQPISTFGRSLFAGEANPFVMVNHGDTVGLITQPLGLNLMKVGFC